MPFIEDSILSLLNSLNITFKNQLATYTHVISEFSVLFYLSTCLFLYQYHITYYSFIVKVESETWRSPNLIFQDCFDYSWSSVISYKWIVLETHRPTCTTSTFNCWAISGPKEGFFFNCQTINLINNKRRLFLDLKH